MINSPYRCHWGRETGHQQSDQMDTSGNHKSLCTYCTFRTALSSCVLVLRAHAVITAWVGDAAGAGVRLGAPGSPRGALGPCDRWAPAPRGAVRGRAVGGARSPLGRLRGGCAVAGTDPDTPGRPSHACADGSR